MSLVLGDPPNGSAFWFPLKPQKQRGALKKDSPRAVHLSGVALLRSPRLPQASAGEDTSTSFAMFALPESMDLMGFGKAMLVKKIDAVWPVHSGVSAHTALLFCSLSINIPLPLKHVGQTLTSSKIRLPSRSLTSCSILKSCFWVA